MPRQTNKLTVRKLTSLTEPGLYGDGGGLYFQVSKWQTESWVYRFSLNRVDSEESGVARMLILCGFRSVIGCAFLHLACLVDLPLF